MRFKIRLAHLAELDDLTDLVLRSKFYWGYDEVHRASLRKLLTVSQERVCAQDCWVAETTEGVKAGICQLDPKQIPAHLDLLFVDPEFIKKGAGTFLFEHVLREAHRRSISRISMDADPHAAEFYLRKGGRIIGEIESTIIRGQLLPIIEFIL